MLEVAAGTENQIIRPTLYYALKGLLFAVLVTGRVFTWFWVWVPVGLASLIALLSADGKMIKDKLAKLQPEFEVKVWQ